MRVLVMDLALARLVEACRNKANCRRRPPLLAALLVDSGALFCSEWREDDKDSRLVEMGAGACREWYILLLLLIAVD
jgi:hypothetical protein